MAISSFSAQTLSAGGFAQIQQQQALRIADQAEQRARALQSQARSAQAAASNAQETARTLKVQANQAQGEASSARQGLLAQKSLEDVQAQLGVLRNQISAILNPETEARKVAASASNAFSSSSTVAPVVNVFGQATGMLVNVTA